MKACFPNRQHCILLCPRYGGDGIDEQSLEPRTVDRVSRKNKNLRSEVRVVVMTGVTAKQHRNADVIGSLEPPTHPRPY